jgi:hypothetical protein
MRVIVKGSELKAAAYAGTYVVVLAWDTLDGKMPSRTDLLGYAIERAELDLSGNEVERYWMRGIDEIRQEFPNRLVRACARVSSSARRLCRSPTPTPPAGCPLDGAIMMPCPEGGRPFKVHRPAELRRHRRQPWLLLRGRPLQIQHGGEVVISTTTISPGLAGIRRWPASRRTMARHRLVNSAPVRLANGRVVLSWSAGFQSAAAGEYRQPTQ